MRKMFLVFCSIVFSTMVIEAQHMPLKRHAPEYVGNGDADSGSGTANESRYEALSATPLPAGFEFGANSHWAAGSSLDRAVEMNMRWVRTGAGWGWTEREFATPPKYDWTIADAIVAACRARELKMNWGLGGTPEWASSNGKENGVPKNALARERFRLFVRAFVERYRYDIDYFNILNEPNLEMFWIGSIDEYIDYFLIPAYEEIKAIDPTKKIVGPDLAGLSGGRIKAEDFWKRLGERHAGQYIDIIAQHSYEETPTDIAERFEKGEYAIRFWFIRLFRTEDSFYDMYKNAGMGDKPIWLTEFGWRSDKVGETRQANFLVEMLGWLAKQPRIKNAFIYELQDDPRWNQKWGMLRADGTPKVVYEKLKQVYEQSAQALQADDTNDFSEQGMVMNQPVDRTPRVYIDKDPNRKEK